MPSKTNRTQAISAALANFDQLPDSAYVSLPTIAALRDTSETTVWRHVKKGLIPQGEKIGPNTTRWSVGTWRSWFPAKA